MTDYSGLKRLAEGMKGWDKMTACWPSDENGQDWQVGRLDEDENRWALLTVDAGQYDQEQDAPKIAQYYAAANAAAVLGLVAEVDRLRREEKNDAIAYKAVIERQKELRLERDCLQEGIDELRKTAVLREELREELGFSSWRELTESFSRSEQHRNDLQDTIVALRTEIGALRKDAERLNWLTEQGEIEQPGQGDVRGFIDAAMSKEG